MKVLVEKAGLLSGWEKGGALKKNGKKGGGNYM